MLVGYQWDNHDLKLPRPFFNDYDNERFIFDKCINNTASLVR